MSTWNAITIERPGALTVDTLPEALTGYGEIWEGYSADDERETIPERQMFAQYVRAERPGNPNGVIVISGSSKWRPDAAIAALIELSKTTGRITHRQEWDDDEVGQEVAVYENGSEVEAERRVSGLVPANLGALLDAARAALDATDADATQRQQEALRGLVAALADV